MWIIYWQTRTNKSKYPQKILRTKISGETINPTIYNRSKPPRTFIHRVQSNQRLRSSNRFDWIFWVSASWYSLNLKSKVFQSIIQSFESKIVLILWYLSINKFIYTLRYRRRLVWDIKRIFVFELRFHIISTFWTSHILTASEGIWWE